MKAQAISLYLGCMEPVFRLERLLEHTWRALRNVHYFLRQIKMFQ
jgi:hypothetical protein